MWYTKHLDVKVGLSEFEWCPHFDDQTLMQDTGMILIAGIGGEEVSKKFMRIMVLV